MKTCVVVLALVLPVFLCGNAAGAEDAPNAASPLQVTRTFFDLLKAGKITEAVALIHLSAEAPPGTARALRQRLSRPAREAAAGRWVTEALEENISGDCAVVMVNEKVKEGKPTFDLDPFYLIRIDGRWKISPGLSDYRHLIGPDEKGLKEYRELEAWYDRREAEIRKERQKQP